MEILHEMVLECLNNGYKNVDRFQIVDESVKDAYLEKCKTDCTSNTYHIIKDLLEDGIKPKFIEEMETLMDEPPEPFKNLCTVCGVDLGPENPRQLCRKTYCENAPEGSEWAR